MEADAAVSDIASAAISTALNGDFPALEKDLELSEKGGCKCRVASVF